MTHKNPPEFWGLDDEWAVKRGFAPACPITYNSRCEDCIYRHECKLSEYENKDPEKTFVLRYDEFNKCFRWVEVYRWEMTKEESHQRERSHHQD